MSALPAPERFAREASSPVRAWATHGFAMGLFGATKPFDLEKPFPRPSSAFLDSAFGSPTRGVSASELEARMDFVETCQRLLMAEEMAAVSRHYALRGAGMAVDFLAQMATLCTVALAVWWEAPMPLVWAAFLALSAWIGGAKPLLGRRALRREADLARAASATAAPWSSDTATA